MKKYILSIIFITSLMFSSLFAQAEMTSRLSDALAEASKANSTVRTLVILKDQVDISKLDKQLYETKATLEERAYTVITTLQDKANSTQGSLLEYLGNKYKDEVAEFRSFWITNMVFVDAVPSVILEMAERSDLAVLDIDAELSWDKPVKREPAAAKVPGGIEPGLAAINAPAMWAAGFTGAGRIVMNDDTGVDGNHPALNYKWRGTHVPASQAWFSWNGATTFPVDGDGHGTHTMGTMCGLEVGTAATADTVGVAPGAEWIASDALFGSPHTSYSIAAWQWAVDPDGNPGTIDDMPDAIGNSWFDPNISVSAECDPALNPYIPAHQGVEAAGIAIIFSAGNSGPSAQSITQPKNVNIDEVTFWATGSVNGNLPSYPISSFSSRGPVQSNCTTGTPSLDIKPEACAPGENVRSSTGGSYASFQGTSMACPHVVGAIALLREAHPSITGKQAKMALYQTAVDLGDPGEDNTYGMGIIDVYAAHMSLADPDDPNPPTDFTAYSDYLTPTSMLLNWTDPSNYVNGTALTNFQIYVYRDGASLATVASGAQTYTDNTVSEGTEYSYSIMAADIPNDSLSMEVFDSWTAGGSAFPAPPQNLGVAATTTDAVLTWTDPTTQSDGTFLDDLDHINIYRNGSVIGSVNPGIQTYTDVPTPGFTYTYTVTAVDNETAANESDPSNPVIAFIGTTPAYLVWVHPDVAAGTPSEASGDSIFNSLVANGESAFLTNDLFEFGSDLSIYDGIFVVLGIYTDNGILIDPEGSALESYLQNGGKIFLEGGDCFNYDPDVSGYQVRPWFDLDDGPDGSGDLAGVIGLNDLSVFTFAYNGSNNWMDELQPLASTPVWQNDANADISGVFNVGFGGGTGRAIGVVPSFGGFVSSTLTPLNSMERIAQQYISEKGVIADGTKPARIPQERTVPFVKKAAWYPELKAEKKPLSDLVEFTAGGFEIKANTQDDLMAAYIGLFTTTGNPTIAVDPMTIDDTLEIGNSNDHILTISNVGGSLAGALITDLAESVSWMTVSPTADTITANQSADFTISLDATGLTTGTYTTTIDITSNDPVTPLVQVAVTLEVLEAPIIGIDPTSFSKSLLTGEVELDTLSISNTGSGLLEFDIQIDGAKENTSFRILNDISKRSVVLELPLNTKIKSGNFEQYFSSAKSFAPGSISSLVAKSPNTPKADISFILDDGSRENALGLTAGGQFIWMNRFTPNPSDFPFTLQEVQVLFGLNVGVNVGELVDIYVYEDTDGDGDPGTGAVYLNGITDVPVQFTDDINFSVYQLPPIVLNGPGDVIIAVVNRTAGIVAGSYVAALDETASQGRSWIGTYLAGNPPSPPLLPADDLWGEAGTLGFPGNWMVRGYGVTGAVGGWLSVAPDAGTVASGGSVDVEVTFDAAGMLGGDYSADILVNSNDPATPQVIVTADLHVTGAAAIGVTPDSLVYESVYTVVTDTATFTVENTGTDVLTVTGMSTPMSEFTILGSTSFTLGIGETQDVDVTFYSAVVGTFIDSIVISSDASNGDAVVHLIGESIEPPVIGVDPTSFTKSLLTGEVEVDTLTIGNTGLGLLEFDITTESTTTDVISSIRILNRDNSTNFVKPEIKRTNTEASKNATERDPESGNSNPIFLNGTEALGDLVGYIDIETPTALVGNLGVGFDGMNLWVTARDDVNGHQLNVFDLSGTLLAQYPQGTTSVWGMRDMAFDGTYLYAGDDNGFYQIDPSNGAVTNLGAFPNTHTAVGGVIRALAYDPANDAFWTGNFSSDIVMFDRNDNVLATYANPIAGIYGMAYDVWSSGGPYLWAFAQAGTPTDLEIAQIDPATGLPTGIGFSGDATNLGTAGGCDWIPGQYISGQLTLACMQQETPDAIYIYDMDAAAGAGWLSFNPTSGSVVSGGNVNVEVTFDAAGLFGGDYSANILVNSNDPITPVETVTVDLHVTGAPAIGATEDSLNYGTIFTVETDTLTFGIRNTGTDLLTVTGMTNSLTEFTNYGPTSFSLNAGETQDVNVAFHSAIAGTFTDTITITSDASNGDAFVYLTGTTIEAPVVGATPDSMAFSLNINTVDSMTLTITNSGNGPLYFTLDDEDANSKLAKQPEVDLSYIDPSHQVEIGKDEIDWRQGTPQTEGAGGPDLYGYTWKDSDEPGGPTFNWIDISATGTVVTGLLDDNHVGPFPVGFSFNFYGMDYTEFYVQSNGLISFDDSYITLGNAQIPVQDSYNNLIAWLWDDMDPVGSTVYYQNVGNTLVIQFEHYFEYPDGGFWVDAEMILSPNGKIVIQYDYFEPGFDLVGCTIGIENADGSDGLQVAYNGAYLHDQLALVYALDSDWLSSNPTSGTVAPGGTADVQVIANTDQMSGGDYLANVIIESNDPATPEYRVPVSLHVIDVTGIDDLTDALPTKYALHQNFPNPFNPTTTIKYDLKAKTDVKLTLFNVLGQKVRTLINKNQAAGFKSVVWDGLNEYGEQVSTGIYIYRIEADDFVKSRKMVFMK